MPAVAVVVEVVVAAVSTDAVAAAVGGVIANTFIAAVATGAIVGVESAVAGTVVNDVVNNQPIVGSQLLKAAEKGALTGAVVGGVGQQLLGSAPSKLAPDGSVGLFGTAETATAGERALTAGLKGTAGALASGENLKTAAEGGLVSGLVDYAIPTKGGNDYVGGVEKALATSGLKQALGIGQSTPSAAAGRVGATAGMSATPQAGQSPGSAALGQALNVGDAGSPVMGAGTDDKAGKKGAWNVESIRNTGTPSESENA
jgi:hypothetical protein